MSGRGRTGGGAVSGAGMPQTGLAKLAFGRSCIQTGLGDSTGNGVAGGEEWFWNLGRKLAAANPNAQVHHKLWSDGSQAYGAADVIQAASTAVVTAFRDTFETGSGEVYGRSPDVVGSAWGRDGANASGDWTVTGGKMVRTADTTVGGVIFGGTQTGDQKITLAGMTWSTVGSGAAVYWRVYARYADGSNSIMLNIAVSAAGAVTSSLYKRIAGANTQLDVVANPAAIPGSTASVTGDLVIEQIGTALTVKFGGTTVHSVTLPADVLTATEAATMAVIGGGVGNLIGMSIDEVRLDVTPTAGTTQTITMYNGSMPGQPFAYQLARLSTMLPADSDVVWLSSVHNYAGTSGAAYAAIVQDMVAAVRAQAPNAAVIVCSQNPQKAPATDITGQGDRCMALREMCRLNGLLYLPVYEKFMATANWQTLILADGYHPTQGTTGTGSSLWGDLAMSLITAQAAV